MNVGRLIEEGGSTIVAGFLRRAQAVVFGRSLVRTKHDRLGLVSEKTERGDYVCILFGCTVPVILRKVFVTEEERTRYNEEEKAGLAENEKSTARLVTAIRRQQLDNRRLDKWRQRRLWFARVLKALRFVLAIFLVWYFRTQREALLELTLVIVALVLTSTTRFTNLRNWENILKLRWLFEDPVHTRMILFGLVSLHLRDFKKWTYETTIITFVTISLFPALILVPLGLQNIFTLARINLLFQTAVQKSVGLAEAVRTTPTQIKSKWQQSRPKQAATKAESDAEGGGHYWTLVGACYVHGIMDGEATEWQTRTKTRRVTFEIR